MISASDELKIFQNILAQSPQGLNDPQLIGKFAKAKAMLHMNDSMNQMQNEMPMGVPQSPQATQTPQPMSTPPQEELGEGGLGNEPPPMV
jgi:hypothetical protein